MRKILFISAAIFFAAQVNAATVSDLLIKGGRAYKKEKYGEALQYFKDAASAAPEDNRPAYNTAAALYKLKDYGASAKIYEDLGQKNWKEREDSYFNAGNAQYRAANKDAAKQNYRTALLMNPGDIEAAHNLQILLSENPKDNKSENKDNSDKQDKDNKQGQGSNDNQNQMSKSDARRMMQMAKEQERKDRSRSEQKYGEAGGGVEKDW
ncbi:MAG: hypothetical protein LBI01_02515 [Elusimicrobium sp.]|jgi:tetratricopeptide (TPR) repeat protein|nr:hypothetical protein [Elusimicrobium sp.]